VDCKAVRAKWAVASVTVLPGPQNRLTARHRKEAQKAERFSGLICALLAVMATEGTKRFIDLFIPTLLTNIPLCFLWPSLCVL
jgi:hypothetical protein